MGWQSSPLPQKGYGHLDARRGPPGLVWPGLAWPGPWDCVGTPPVWLKGSRHLHHATSITLLFQTAERRNSAECKHLFVPQWISQDLLATACAGVHREPSRFHKWTSSPAHTLHARHTFVTYEHLLGQRGLHSSQPLQYEERTDGDSNSCILHGLPQQIFFLSDVLIRVPYPESQYPVTDTCGVFCVFFSLANLTVLNGRLVNVICWVVREIVVVFITFRTEELLSAVGLLLPICLKKGFKAKPQLRRSEPHNVFLLSPFWQIFTLGRWNTEPETTLLSSLCHCSQMWTPLGQKQSRPLHHKSFSPCVMISTVFFWFLLPFKQTSSV